jgi:hypothetical protein
MSFVLSPSPKYPSFGLWFAVVGIFVFVAIPKSILLSLFSILFSFLFLLIASFPLGIPHPLNRPQNKEDGN